MWPIRTILSLLVFVFRTYIRSSYRAKEKENRDSKELQAQFASCSPFSFKEKPLDMAHTLNPLLGLYRLRRLLGVYLLPVLVESNSRRRGAVPTTFTRPNTIQTWLIRLSILFFACCSSKREREAYRTILPWMAQDTQYCSLRYILGTAYSGKTEASEISPRNHCQIVVHQFSFFFFPRGNIRTIGFRRFKTYGLQPIRPCF